MPFYKVKDVMGLYPDLIKVARLHQDDGDTDPVEPPYQMTPEDLDKYNSTFTFLRPDIKIKGRQPTIFEMVELYRHLVYYDKADGALDGNIGKSQHDETVTIPFYAEGYHYWGESWQPLNRLTAFLDSLPPGMLNEVIKEFEHPDFELSKSSALDTVKDFNEKGKLPTEKERKFIRDLIQEVSEDGFVEYSDLLKLLEADDFRLVRIHDHYVIPDITERSGVEAKEFGYVDIYDFGDDSKVFFVRYPQFGQKGNAFASRDVTVLYNSQKKPVERWAPLAGWNEWREAYQDNLERYAKEKPLRVENGKSERERDYKWARIGYYLRRARVYNILRYELWCKKKGEDEKVAHRFGTMDGKKVKFRLGIEQEKFFRCVVLHEALHYRNIKAPRTMPDLINIKTMLPTILNLMRYGGKNYDVYHFIGNFLVHLQRVADEGWRDFKIKRAKLCDKLEKEGKDPANDPTCQKINRYLGLLEQLRILAVDAEERLVEDEVFSVLFTEEVKEGRVRKPDWYDPKALILNKNEIELLMREEKKQQERQQKKE